MLRSNLQASECIRKSGKGNDSDICAALRGLGCRVWGSEFRVQGSGFRV